MTELYTGSMLRSEGVYYTCPHCGQRFWQWTDHDAEACRKGRAETKARHLKYQQGLDMTRKRCLDFARKDATFQAMDRNWPDDRVHRVATRIIDENLEALMPNSSGGGSLWWEALITDMIMAARDATAATEEP